MTMGDLIPPPEVCSDRYRAARRAAQQLLAGGATSAFNVQPAPGRWSAAQCLDHLNTMGEKVHRRMESAIAEAREQGLYGEGPFRYGMLDRLFVKSMQPDPWIRIPSPSAYEPTEDDLDSEETVAAFSELQDRLIASAEEAEELDLKRIKIVSPVSRWFRFSLGAWLAATAAHQERHLQQAREALRAARQAEA